MDKVVVEKSILAILEWCVKFLLNPAIFRWMWNFLIVKMFSASPLSYWEAILLFIMIDCVAALFRITHKEE
jgi:hypothetical protein